MHIIIFMQCITIYQCVNKLKTVLFTIFAIYLTGFKCSTYQKTTQNINSISNTSNPPRSVGDIASCKADHMEYVELKYTEVHRFESGRWRGVISLFLTPTGHIALLLTLIKLQFFFFFLQPHQLQIVTHAWHPVAVGHQFLLQMNAFCLAELVYRCWCEWKNDNTANILYLRLSVSEEPRRDQKHCVLHATGRIVQISRAGYNRIPMSPCSGHTHVIYEIQQASVAMISFPHTRQIA